MNKQGNIPFWLWVLLLLLIACVSPACQNEAKSSRKKVFYVNSYHRGYPASDQIMQGIEVVFRNEAVEWDSFYLDSKRNGDSLFLTQQTTKLMKRMDEFNPDALIVSDDAAVKFVVLPWFWNKTLPVVFCGVNWSAKQYGLPVKNVTGMLEVLPLRTCLQTMKEYYPQAKQLMVLSEKSLSEEKNTQLLDTLYKALGFSVRYALVDNFNEWKNAFSEANQTADLIYLPTNGAIKNWIKDEAEKFVQEHIKKPVITCDDFMMPYSVFGLTKVAGEQGRWAAMTTLRILKGTSPASIPVTTNKETTSFINKRLAGKVGFHPSSALLHQSNIIE